ncbi:MAG: MoaD/ThiS family protein [Chloroflexota bacterium]|nr:MoaD/ThiS family protein [Chloroflexota bacterium]
MATVWIPTPYRELAGGASTVVVPGATVRQVTRNLDSAYPGFWERLVDDERDRIRAGITVVVNGVSVGYALYEPVGENDEVHYLPAIAGGAGQLQGTGSQ